MALIALALLGKLVTEWWVLFDPTTVPLPDKPLPPLSRASSALSADQVPPFGTYLFGTDELGRNVFARMLQGSFVSLSVGVVAVSISLTVGILIGGLAGFYGERKLLLFGVDTILMRLTDVVLCFPTFFLILTLAALVPSSIYNHGRID